jgi:hypothetical protein
MRSYITVEEQALNVTALCFVAMSVACFVVKISFRKLVCCPAATSNHAHVHLHNFNQNIF